jgi:serine/threonine-protein kinase RsbT
MNELTKTVSKRIVIVNDLDIVTARLRAREVAREMGFGTIDQARISLAASELARILLTDLNNSGEIHISGVHADGHVGIQVTSLDTSEPIPTGVTPVKAETIQNSALTNAMSLVDESLVEQVGPKSTRITLMKWLK